MTGSLSESLLGNGSAPLVSDKNVDEKERHSGWVLPELRRQFWLAGPMVCVNVLQFSLNLVSVMFVGHLGELALASASVALSFGTVTGFSLMIGLASALETLCGQAYGANQYRMLGVYTQRAILVLCIVCVPVSVLWVFMSPVLRFLGQDPEISDYAGIYTRWLIPAVFAYGVLQPLVKFLQAQSAVWPMAICSFFSLAIHIPTCWLFIFKLGVGYKGAAIAAGVSQWMNVIFLVLYIKFGPTCDKTWDGFSTEAFKDMKAFFKLAIPSTVMICLEYWSFELMVILSGLLPNPQLEMSSVAICMNSIALMYMFPYGLSAAVSTRVSNELGAGRASEAKKAVIVGVSMGVTSGLIVGIVAFSLRHIWPYVFTSELEVVNYVATMMPFLAVLTIADSTQGVLCGVARGCGNQELGAYTNLGAYYVVGVPIAVTLAFYYHLNGRGLWLGMTSALSVEAICLLLLAVFTNWEKQALDAMNRVYADRPLPIHETLVKDDSESPEIQV